MKTSEGRLTFDFSGAWVLCKYDRIPKKQNKQNVDFVVEERNRFLLVEVKDISKFNIKRRDTRFPHQRHATDYFNSIEPKLIKKCIDSARDVHPTPYGGIPKPFIYIVIVDLEGVPGLQRSMLVRWQERLLGTLSAFFATENTPIQFESCVVCDLRAWSKFMSPYTVSRL